MDNNLITLNRFLGQYWLVVLFGLFHLLYLERHEVGTLLRRSGKRAARASFAGTKRRLWYVLGGTALVFLSWAIVTFLFSAFWNVAGSVAPAAPLAVGADFVTAAKYYASYAGLFGVAGLVAAGTCLTLSAGSRWLIVTAKLLATLTFLGTGLLLVLASFPAA